MSLRQEVLKILEAAEDGARPEALPPIRLTTVRTTVGSGKWALDLAGSAAGFLQELALQKSYFCQSSPYHLQSRSYRVGSLGRRSYGEPGTSRQG